MFEQNYQQKYSYKKETENKILNSSTCHNFSLFDENSDFDNVQKLCKNKSESDLLINDNKNKLNKIYLPAEDTMDLEKSYKESTGKKYSSSWFYGDSSKNPYPTIEEQVKLCRKIASQLVDDDNRKSKGASMFFKRVKRAQKWVHEGQGTKEIQNVNSSSSSLVTDEEVEKLKRNLKLEVMPKLKLILDPRELLSLEKLKKTGDIVEHNIISPDVCHNLVKDLNSPEINKGAIIFLKRKEKSRDWVVDENTSSQQIREQKREQELKKQEENVQKEWLMKKQKEVSSDIVLNASQQNIFPKISQNKFNINLTKNKPDYKFEDNCQNVSQNFSDLSYSIPKYNLQANSFPKLNFKNFNRNARGWGVSANDYEKQLENLQQTPEIKSNFDYLLQFNIYDNEYNKNDNLPKANKNILPKFNDENEFAQKNFSPYDQFLNELNSGKNYSNEITLSSNQENRIKNKPLANYNQEIKDISKSNQLEIENNFLKPLIHQNMIHANNSSNNNNFGQPFPRKKNLLINTKVFNDDNKNFNETINTIKHFDLTKLCPSKKPLPKFKDFNAKPKLWTK